MLPRGPVVRAHHLQGPPRARLPSLLPRPRADGRLQIKIKSLPRHYWRLTRRGVRRRVLLQAHHRLRSVHLRLPWAASISRLGCRCVSYTFVYSFTLLNPRPIQNPLLQNNTRPPPPLGAQGVKRGADAMMCVLPPNFLHSKLMLFQGLFNASGYQRRGGLERWRRRRWGPAAARNARSRRPEWAPGAVPWRVRPEAS